MLIPDDIRRSGGLDTPPRARRSMAVFDAAGTGRRFSGWNARQDAINSAIFQDGDLLRRRARDLVRQNWAASNGVEAWTASAIGTGIKPQSRHPNAAVRKTLNDAFAIWASECDSDGRTDFYGLQALAFSAMVEAGECFVRRRDRRYVDPYTVPMQLQLLESEHVPIIKNEFPVTGNRVVMGIELSNLGRVVAYHVHPEHPDDFGFTRSLQTTRISANEMLHVFRPLRPGQRRGTTWLTQAIVKLRDLDKYDDAELVRKKMASMVLWWLTEPNPDDPMLQTEEQDEEGIDQMRLEPGSVFRTKPGEKPEMSDPAVSEGYSDYIRVQLRQVAAAMGITYEMLTGDLSGVNYSSIRAGLIEFRRRCEMIQWSVFIHQFCAPTWEWFLRAAALAGIIDASDLRANYRDYQNVNWHTPRWQWVDPEKDVKAEKLQVDAGFKARSTVINEMGEDPETVDLQIAEDKKRADSLGLVFPSQIQQSQPPNQKQEQPA